MPQTLIIDDDADTRDLLATALSVHGHMIKCAASREEALRIFSQTPCEIVILDWYMNGMLPAEFVHKIRALKHDVRIILITSRDEVEEKAAILNLSFYVGKPFDESQMLQAIQCCMAG